MKIARIVVVGVVILGLVGLLIYSQRRAEPIVVSGFIESHEIRLGSRIGGRVAEVLIEEGDPVKAGDPLVRLEPYDLMERKLEAEALVQQKKETLRKLQVGFRPEEIAAAAAEVKAQESNQLKLQRGPRQQEINAAIARLALADADMNRAQIRYDRLANLLTKSAASKEAVDEAERELKVAQARRQVAEDELALAQEGTREEDLAIAAANLERAQAEWQLLKNGTRKEEIEEAAAALQAAEASLAIVETQLEELVIRAPLDAIVQAIELRPGDLLNANAPALTVVDPSELWVRAYVPENRLDIQLGDALDVTVDSYPNRRFSGRVIFVSREAEFTPRNVQTPEERSKQVFRIKVALDDKDHLLRSGMAADVWLNNRGDKE